MPFNVIYYLSNWYILCQTFTSAKIYNIPVTMAIFPSLFTNLLTDGSKCSYSSLHKHRWQKEVVESTTAIWNTFENLKQYQFPFCLVSMIWRSQSVVEPKLTAKQTFGRRQSQRKTYTDIRKTCTCVPRTGFEPVISVRALWSAIFHFIPTTEQCNGKLGYFKNYFCIQ